MGQTNVKELLRKLVAVQKIDAELFEYRRGLKEKPAELEALALQFEAKKTKYHGLETRAKDLDLERKKKELDLKVKDEEIVKHSSSLMLLKTNKEYQARLFEIENMKADKSILEEEILKAMDACEKIQQDIAREKEVLAGEEAKFQAAKAKIEGEIQALEDQSRGFEVQRREASQSIDKATMAVYDRVLENRGGMALVPVNDCACGGCFMNVPPQVFNKIRMYDELVRCEFCARFLYLAEEV